MRRITSSLFKGPMHRFPGKNQERHRRALAEESDIELVACVSSALRRGVLDSTEAERPERVGATLDPAFSIGGLGLLVETGAESDRLLTFGGRS